MADPIFSASFDDSVVQERLRRLLRRTQNLRPALADIGEEMLLRTDEGFESEEDPFGVKWAPLSSYTLSFKAQNRRILKILQSTGRLRSSITYRIDGDRLTVGTNVSYAYKHQMGVGTAKRQFLGIGPETRLEIIAILEDHILGS